MASTNFRFIAKAIKEGDTKLPGKTGAGIAAVIIGVVTSFASQLRQEYTYLISIRKF